MPARRRAPLRPAIVAGLALWLMVPWLGPGSAHALALDCQRVPDLMHTFLQKHISFHYLDSELRKRAVDGYIERLDSAKTLFLAAEVDDLRARLAGIFLDLRTRSGPSCPATTTRSTPRSTWCSTPTSAATPPRRRSGPS